MAKFLIVEARFYDHLNDMLVAGAKAALTKAGHEVDVITVPGALEIPGAINLADAAQIYDGYVAIGVVIRGETYHFEIVAGESAIARQPDARAGHARPGAGFANTSPNPSHPPAGQSDHPAAGARAIRRSGAGTSRRPHLPAASGSHPPEWCRCPPWRGAARRHG